MENIIELYIESKNSLYDEYNKKRVSKNLLNYLIEETLIINKKNKIKIKIKNKVDTENNSIELIKEGLKNEYKSYLRRYNHNNLIQLLFCIMGVIFLIFSTLTAQLGIVHELLSITGCVLIWDTIEVELFSDLENRRKRAAINKLLISEFIEERI